MENKVKNKFNLIDVLVILAVLAVAIGIFVRYNISDNFGVRHDSVNAEITLLISDMRPSSEAAFKIGDTVIWDNKDMLLGTLIDAEFSGAAGVVQRADGIAVPTVSETRIDAVIKVQAVGTMTDEGFMLGGNQYIAPGSDVGMRTPQISVVGIVTDVTQIPS